MPYVGKNPRFRHIVITLGDPRIIIHFGAGEAFYKRTYIGCAKHNALCHEIITLGTTGISSDNIINQFLAVIDRQIAIDK